eukprot:1057479-Amphidinium_carterae.1
MVWHEEPDKLRYQAYPQQPQAYQQQPTGTPSQPMPTQIATLYNVGAVININEKTLQTYKEFWAIILDSGAAVSICPTSFCPHVPVTTMPEE